MTAVTAARPALRHRLAERGIDRTLLLLVPGLLVIACLFLYPFLYGLQLSFAPRRGGIFANYARFSVTRTCATPSGRRWASRCPRRSSTSSPASRSRT